MSIEPTPSRPDHRSGRLAGAATIAALLIATAACSAEGTTTTTPTTAMPTSTEPATTTPTSTTTAAARPTGDVDRRFEVSGAQIHLRCSGEGEQTVVLIAGYEGSSEAWAMVEPQLSRSTRVCSYDRPGTGTSGPATAATTFATQATQLDALLSAAGEPGPYVVVGHSFGGAAAMTFASAHREQVTGVVLVDASPATWPDQICAVPADGSAAATMLRGLCGSWATPDANIEHLDVFRAFAGTSQLTSLGSLPLTVITAQRRELPEGLAAAEVDRLEAAWAAGQRRWAGLSNASTVVEVPNSGHNVQIEHPDVVTEAITGVINSPGTP